MRKEKGWVEDILLFGNTVIRRAWVANAFNPSIREVEAGGSLWIQTLRSLGTRVPLCCALLTPPSRQCGRHSKHAPEMWICLCLTKICHPGPNIGVQDWTDSFRKQRATGHVCSLVSGVFSLILRANVTGGRADATSQLKKPRQWEKKKLLYSHTIVCCLSIFKPTHSCLYILSSTEADLSPRF